MIKQITVCKEVRKRPVNHSDSFNFSSNFYDSKSHNWVKPDVV